MSCECSGCARCCAAKKPEWTYTDLTSPAATPSPSPVFMQRVCDDIEHDFDVTKNNAGERILFCHKCGTTRSL